MAVAAGGAHAPAPTSGGLLSLMLALFFKAPVKLALKSDQQSPSRGGGRGWRMRAGCAKTGGFCNDPR